MLRHLRSLLVIVALPTVAAVAAAQGPEGGTTVPDSLYQKAQRLVVSGNGADGRALVDSLLDATSPGSPDHAEALYWKAALADNAAEAERGYLKLTIEYPLSPRTEAALLRLGQLELTRGNRAAALSRFERAAREFPASPQRAHSLYTIGRVQLEDGRVREGCVAVHDAQSALPADDVELRNKVDYLARQCVGVALEAPADSGPPSGGRQPGSRVAAAPTRPAPTRSAPARPAAPPVVERPAPIEPPTTEPQVEPQVEPQPEPSVAPPAAQPAAPVAPPVVRPPAPRPPAATTPVRPAPVRTAPARTAPARPAASARGSWSVQVAAFDRAAPARDLAEKLRKDGFDARVDADEKWHRVRIGHYATRAAAAKEARTLKARGVTGFVTGSG